MASNTRFLMVRRLNKKGIIAVAFISGLLLSVIVMFVVYFSSLKAVSKSDDVVLFSVNDGDTYFSLASKLEDANLIRSTSSYKIYLKFHRVGNLKVGKFSLNKNMGVKKIVETLSSDNYSEDYVVITFKEGINIKSMASLIADKTNITEEEIFNTLKDESYIDSLINDYWFLTDEIKNSDIYYPLEGYLFPDTYQFRSDCNIKDIFKVLLDEMDSRLSNYKVQIESSSLSIHKLLTLASIVELEAGTSHERSGVASVFYNRINNDWTLGSDVTTYYAFQKSFKEDLLASEIDSCNAYNTRGTCFTGLPVGPIANPSIESIDGVMNPTSSDYFYFVADKNGQTYFNTNEFEHLNTIAMLKRDDLWYIYE